MQKLKECPHGISEKGGPEAAALFASPNIHPSLYTYNLFSPRSHYFAKFPTSN